MDSPELNRAQSTPMGRIWKVVLASMLFTIITGAVWHIIALEETRMDNQHESDVLRTEILKLSDYRATLIASSTTAKNIPQE